MDDEQWLPLVDGSSMVDQWMMVDALMMVSNGDEY